MYKSGKCKLDSMLLCKLHKLDLWYFLLSLRLLDKEIILLFDYIYLGSYYFLYWEYALSILGFKYFALFYGHVKNSIILIMYRSGNRKNKLKKKQTTIQKHKLNQSNNKNKNNKNKLLIN